LAKLSFIYLAFLRRTLVRSDRVSSLRGLRSNLLLCVYTCWLCYARRLLPCARPFRRGSSQWRTLMFLTSHCPIIFPKYKSATQGTITKEL